jgi:hypothetical protein
MKRDPIQEWRRALVRRATAPGREPRWSAITELPPLPAGVATPAGGTRMGDAAAALSGSRGLTAPSWSDFGAAIRVLQRHNKLLSARFGIEWADAATVVRGEAQRRGASAAALARLLVAGLRADAAGGAR